MGNYKFRLSDMMPNAWFYKLRDMNKARNQTPPFHPTKKKLLSPTQNPRKSFHYTPESIRVDNLYNLQNNSRSYHDTDHFHRIDDSSSPRKSSKRRTKRKTIYKPSPKKIIPSVSVDCDSPETVEIQGYFHSPVNLHASPEKDFLESPSSGFKCFDSQYESLNEGIDSCSSCCSCKLSSTATDIIIDMDETFRKVEKVTEFNMISKPGLSPIVTKPATRKIIAPVESQNFNCISSPKFDTEISIQPKKNTKVTTNVTNPIPTTRKSVPRSRGVKIRSNFPRTKNRKTETCARKSVKDDKKGCFYSESFAMVKASFDPEKDFRDSMMEMIVENNLRASKELEELLACYLSLNSNQYHDLIIKAFEQIWFNLCSNPICS